MTSLSELQGWPFALLLRIFKYDIRNVGPIASDKVNQGDVCLGGKKLGEKDVLLMKLKFTFN